MSTLSNYLKMDFNELEKEISKQQRKLTSVKETIVLLRKLQVATQSTNENHQPAKQQKSSMQQPHNVTPLSMQ